MYKSNNNTRVNLSRQPRLTGHQLAELKKGPRVNIMLGSDGNRYIGLENVPANLLTHFFPFAKERLPGNQVLYLPDGDKTTLKWIIAYVTNNEHNPANLQTLESLRFDELVKVYKHSKVLECSDLRYQVAGLLKKLYTGDNYSMPTPYQIEVYAADVTELLDYAVRIVADEITYPYTFDYSPYTSLAQELPAFGEPLENAVRELVDQGIAASEKYYRTTKNPAVLRAIAYAAAVRSDMDKKAKTASAKSKATFKDPRPQKSALRCWKCGNDGHIRRDCKATFTIVPNALNNAGKTAAPVPRAYNYTARNTSDKPANIIGPDGTPGPINEAKHPSSRRGPIKICHACKKPGHIVRLCHSEPAKDAVGIALFEDGEGLKTCVREVEVGEMTRTGLRI